MKNNILSLLWILLSIPICIAQNNEQQNYFLKAQQFHYTNKDSAYYYYQKSIEKSRKNKDYTALLNTYIYLVNLSGNHYDLEVYSSTIKAFDSLVNDLKNSKQEVKNLKMYEKYLRIYQIDYLYGIKDYASAKEAINKLVNHLNAIPTQNKTKEDYSFQTSAYSYLAGIYKNTDKLNFAKSVHLKDIAFILKHKDNIIEWENAINNSKKLLAAIYAQQKEFKKSEELLDEAQLFYVKKITNPEFKNNLISLFHLKSKNAFLEKKYDKAIKILNQSKRFYYQNNPFAKEFIILKGDIYLAISKYDSAIYFYTKSLHKTIGYKINKKHQDIAEIYQKIAKVYHKESKYSLAKKYIQKALMQLDNNFNSINLDDNPSPETVTSHTILISILKEKQDILLDSFNQTNDLTDLTQAYKTSFVIIETLDLLKPEFADKMDRQFLIENTYPSIQKMIEISYILFNNSKDKTYLNNAFYFIEKSKSILLLEAQRNAEATKYGGIPNSVLEKEKQYRARISYFEEKIFKKNSNQNYMDTLSKIKNNYYDFISSLEKKYPKYYQLKYNQKVYSADEIQYKLPKNTTMISYLATVNSLYVVKINRHKKYFYKLNYTNTTRNLLTNLYTKSASLNIKDNTIFDISNKVYKQILAPVLKDENNQNLIILNDDLLNYIPLDGLVTNINDLRFVIQDFTVSYENSATLWRQHQKKEKKYKNSLLAFAPSFNKKYFNPLKYNVKEVNKIKNHFKSTIFINNKATLQNFNENYKKYNLIHLATHAIVNDSHPEYSFLTFSNSTKNNNLLYIKDLYNYHLKTDLVTLSACETGIGKLQKGEGMLSLSRAFNYAGATTLVTTLWKINDESTSNIITYFYKNLKSGYSKSESLRRAKLKYLKENNNDEILMHPYYWSGITISGNTNALTHPKYYYFWIIGLLILILFLFRKKLWYFFK